MVNLRVGRDPIITKFGDLLYMGEDVHVERLGFSMSRLVRYIVLLLKFLELGALEDSDSISI